MTSHATALAPYVYHTLTGLTAQNVECTDNKCAIENIHQGSIWAISANFGTVNLKDLVLPFLWNFSYS